MALDFICALKALEGEALPKRNNGGIEVSL